MKKIFRASTCTVAFTALLSAVGAARGAEKELLFPILTHVGNYDSRIFVLNPTKYRVIYKVRGTRASGGGVTYDNSASPMKPHSTRSYRPDGGYVPHDYRGGWGSVRYCFLGVPEDDKERVENLSLLAWTELRLSKLRRRPDSANPVIAVASIPAVESALEFRVAGVHQKNPRAEGPPEAEATIAILNPSDEPVQIEATLFHYNNEEEAQVKNTLVVPPENRLSRFLWELMTEGQDDPPERPDYSSRSTLRIRGSAPIAVGALIYYSNGTFGNLPVVRVDQR